MECPYCGLINPANARICDCGYNFETKTPGKPNSPKKVSIKRTTGQRFLIASGILALLGGGTCFLATIPVRLPGDPTGLGMVIVGGLGGLGALVIAAILGIIGLIMVQRDG